jgi:hypothetical protein
LHDPEGSSAMLCITRPHSLTGIRLLLTISWSGSPTSFIQKGIFSWK